MLLHWKKIKLDRKKEVHIYAVRDFSLMPTEQQYNFGF